MTQLYEIRLKGHLDLAWSEWLDDLTIIHQDNGESLLTGPVADQAALHGILNRLRDIGIPLISVNPVDIRRLTLASESLHEYQNEDAIRPDKNNKCDDL